jgi:hypothetical protein
MSTSRHTTIAIKPETLERLRSFARAGESRECTINRLMDTVGDLADRLAVAQRQLGEHDAS